MCGICGMIDTVQPPSRQILQQMNDCIYHRGPDDEGFYLDTSCGLAMRRLSIIDLVTGKQPIHNEDETVWVVLNGELYNFLDLREDLLKKGHRFYTKTDTEVVVHLYEEYGEEFVKHIWGMFGVAVWDTKQKRLIIARDRVGKKPLYYRQHETGIVFGSEIKSILQDPRFEPQLNHEALFHYLTLQYVPAPLSIYKHIHKLPPAHYLVYEKDSMRIERYWEVSMEKKIDCSYDEAKERLRALLMDAVKIRMISDVPLGAFLSGGIDSSLIVGLMAQQSTHPVKTFTIGFEEEKFNETPYAKRIADMFKTEHHVMTVRPESLNIIEELIWHFDEPFGDSSAIPSYYVAREARKNITVALNGDGGDDSFGGYQRYFIEHTMDEFSKIPGLNIPASRIPLINSCPVKASLLTMANIVPMGKLNHKIKRFYELTGMDWKEAYVTFFMSIFDRQSKHAILSKEFLGSLNGVSQTESFLEDLMVECTSDAKLDKLLYSDFHTYLPGDLLVKMDRMTMAHSLEGRSPLLDHRVIEFAASLPADWKGKDGIGKKILRETFPEILITEIADSPKQGFGVPIGEWFRTDLKDLVTDALDSERFHQRGYFDKAAVRKLLKEHIHDGYNHSHRIWLLLVFEMWHRMFLEERIHRTDRWTAFKKR